MPDIENVQEENRENKNVTPKNVNENISQQETLRKEYNLKDE